MNAASEHKPQAERRLDERTDATWEEIGFAEYPIVTTSLKRPPFDTLEFVEPLGRDASGQPVNRTWQMVSSTEYGLPRLPDLDVFVAILKALERHRYEKKLIPCTAKDICADVGLVPGGETYKRLRAAFLRFQTTDYVAKNVFTDPTTKQRVISEGWSIIADHRIVADPGDAHAQDGLPASYFAVSSTFLNRLRTGQLKPLDLGLWRQLPLGLEKPIYHYLDKNFHGGKDRHEIGLNKLGKRIGLTGQYKPFDLKRLYKKPLGNLLALGFLSGFRFERSRSVDDPEKVVFLPGPRARTQRQATPRVPTYQTAPELTADERINANSATPEPDIEQLVAYFSLKQFGVEKRTVTPREREAARRILEHAHGEVDVARAIVDYAIREARQTGFKMRSIGGVLTNSYPERALAVREAERSNASEALERRNREDLREQYDKWYRQEVYRRYQGLEAAERDRLFAEALDDLRSGRQGATFLSWPEHSRRLILEGKARRRLGRDLPSFEEWVDSNRPGSLKTAG